jgi:hypothetical protein
VVVCSNFYLGSFTQKLGPKPSLHICLQPEQTSKVGRQRAPLAGSLCRCSLASHRASGPEAFRASGPEAFRASGPEAFRASGPEAFRASGPEAFRASGPEAFFRPIGPLLQRLRSSSPATSTQGSMLISTPTWLATGSATSLKP